MKDESMYDVMLKEYPDMLNVKQMSEILRVSEKRVCKLLEQNPIHSVKVGKDFQVKRTDFIDFLCGKDKDGKK